MLPYSAEVVFSLYERYIGELWPGALPVLASTLAVVVMAAGGRPRGRRTAGALLGLGWLWVGMFHYRYFAVINFAAPVYAGLFALQGLLLLWRGPFGGRLALRFHRDGPGWIGTALVLLALFGYPLVDYLSGLAAGVPRLAGLAPGPTSLLTLGLLLHVADRVPWHLLAVPVIWSLVAGFSGWVLDIPADLALPGLALLAVVAAGLRNRRMVDTR